jgi:RHS repeat-associated protein
MAGKKIQCFVALYLLALVLLPRNVSAQGCIAGPHNGTILTDQRWCASDSPHNFSGGNVTIAPGVTVTVEAGVTVNADYRSNLTIQGRLVTQGSATQPVTFTGAQWLGLNFAGGTGNLQYSNIVNATYTDPSITASNVPSPGLILDHCIVGPGNQGLILDSSIVTVNNTTFTGINSYPLVVRGTASVLSLSNNSFTGNNPNRLYLDSGAMLGADYSLAPQTGLDAYELFPNYTIPAGRTVTIAAGTTVQAGYRANLTILGRLVTQGTNINPVIFTGPQWTGLNFAGGTGRLQYSNVVNANYTDPSITASNVPSPGLILDHCTVGSGNQGLVLDSSNVTVNDSTFSLINNYPIVVRGASSVLSLSNNSFSGNNPNRIYLAQGAMLGADYTLIPQTGLEAYELASNYTVPVGRTVTLSAGVTVIAGYRANMTIQGKLVTQGTAAQPVTFTGYQWTGLNFAGGTGNLSYCNIANANYTDPIITAINVASPGLFLDHCVVGPTNSGLLVNNSTVTVNDSTFTQVNSYPIYVQGASSVLSLSNNTFSLNNPNYIALDPGAMLGADFTLISQTGLDAYTLTGNYTIPAGRTITLAAGVTVVPAWSAGVTVQGRLVTLGTAARPVTITGGRWTGLVFDGGTGTLAHCILSNGGFNSWSISANNVTTGEIRLESCRVINGSGIYGNNSHVTLINTVISDDGGQAWAIQMTNGSALTATHTTFARNPNVASIETGSTATFTNTIVANSPSGWGIMNDGTATVTMTRTLWDAVARPTSGTIAQNGLINGAAAFAADGYHLTANSMALGQGVATGVIDDIDGEVRPQPARTLPDLGADETSWSAPMNRNATPIALTTPGTGTATTGAFADYALTLSSGQATNLLVRLTPLGGTGTWSLFGRFGNFPLAALFDAQGMLKPDGTLEMLIHAPGPGIWYFSVYYLDQSGASAPFRLEVFPVNHYLSFMTPASGGNGAGTVTAKLTGIGFTSGISVQLRSGATILRSFATVDFGETSLQVQMNLAGLAPQTVDVAAVWPDTDVQILTGAFTILSGGAGHLDATLILPDKARNGRTVTGYLQYANTGTQDLPAPLFFITCQTNVPMRLTSDEPFLRQPLQILGIDMAGVGTAGVLPPGASYQIPFQFISEGGGHELLDFRIAVMMANSSTPIDWASQETDYLLSDIDPQAWQVIWGDFTSSVGTTWDDYQIALRAEASHLSRFSRFVYDTRKLIAARMNQASGDVASLSLASATDALCPAPGPTLVFTRNLRNGIASRFKSGPLGRGWTHNLDVTLSITSSGNVIVKDGWAKRRFTPLTAGYYQASPGDHGILIYSAGVYTLTETNGSVLTFDALNRLSSMTDSYGNRINLGYDASSRVISAVHGSGEHLDIFYDANGRINRVRDWASRDTTYQYDGDSHLIRVTSPEGKITQYTYTAASGAATDHTLTAITFPDGRHRTYSYDAAGRLTGTALDGVQPVALSYDASGTVTATLGNGIVLAYLYDENGKAGELRDGNTGLNAKLTYDSDLNLIRVIDAAGNSARAEYEPLGNVTSGYDSLGGELHVLWAYASSGGAVQQSLTDPLGNRSLFLRDAAGGFAGTIYPDGSLEQITRESHGLVSGIQTRSGHNITYSYDSHGLIAQANHPDGTTVTYNYDSFGRLTQEQSPAGNLTVQYDINGFPSQVTNPSGKWFTYEYDTAGRITKRTGDDGYYLSYTYDSGGRLVRINDSGITPIVQITYDGAGLLAREDRRNGTAAAYTWNLSGRLASMVNYGPGNAVQSSFAYTYDPNGNPLTMTTASGITSFQYDVLGRLTQVTYPSAQVTTITYDAAGNRVQVVDAGIPTVYANNQLNQVMTAGTQSFIYDADGNLVSSTGPAGTTLYQYDPLGQLTQVQHPTAGTFRYTYDTFGRRIAEMRNGVVKSFVWDGPNLAAEYDSGGNLIARYVHGLGLTARLTQTDSAFYAFDGGGNTRQMTDASGTVVNSYDYTPFGVPLATTEAIANPFRFSGRFGVPTDDHGLVFMRMRSYNPTAGRFVSPDPLRYAAGTNLYLYADNNPMSFVDPSGMIKHWYDPVWNIGTTVVGAVPGGVGKGFSALFGSIGTVQGIGSGRKNHSKGESALSDIGSGSLSAMSVLTQIPAVGETVIVGGAEAVATLTLAEVVSIAGAISVGGELVIDSYADSVQVVRDGLERDHGKVFPNPYRYYNDLYHGHIPEAVKQYLEQRYGKKPENITSGDPNEKAAPSGTGPQHFVKSGDRLSFTVYFENMPTASAPAQEVVITDQLDANLDWSSLSLTGAGWGATTLSFPSGGTSFSQRVSISDYRPGNLRTWQVDVTGQLSGAGQITWRFRTVDPATGDLPADPLAGFLPADDLAGRGEGYVSFTVNSKTGLPTGRQIANTASIIFDQNSPMATNQTVNTIGLPGDVNGDGVVDPADLIYLVSYLFGSGPAPVDLADSNGDGVVDALDIFYLSNYLFAGGPAPGAGPILSSAGSPDTLIVGSLSSTPGSTVDIPISVRDLASTPLGMDAGTSNRIQGIAAAISYSPASAVASATIVRSGLTASLTPLFETTSLTSGIVSYLASFSESTNLLPFTQPPSAAGNEVLKLRLTFSATASGVVTLTPQTVNTMLSNQAGTIGESVDYGNLSLFGGTVTLPATTSVVSSVNPSALAQPVTFTATVSPTLGPTGSVQFKADGVNLGAAVTLSGGSAMVTTASLAIGSHAITAEYNGNLGFISGSLTGGQVVNSYGAPANITATGGVTQSAPPGGTFPNALQATVKDAFNNGVPGVLVTFTAPSSGPSGTFAGAGATCTVATGPTGIATAPAFTANGLFGSYQITATASGVSGSAAFDLSNQNVASIPTLTEWGFFILLLSMAGIGMWILSGRMRCKDNLSDTAR